MHERRVHPRVEKRIRVRWQEVDADGGAAEKIGPVEATVTRDVSPGGLGFPVPQELATGTVLALELEREFGGPPLSALCRVARCVKENDGWLAGVEFTWIECALPEFALGLSPASAWTLL